MPSLTVWLYPTPFGADTGELHLRSLVDKKAITVHDAAVVAWPPHDDRPRVHAVRHLATEAAGRGGFWGALVGLVVMNPVAGAAIGAATGATLQRLRGAGIQGDFVEQVRSELLPGSSALLVLSSGADVELVRPVLASTEATLIRADLSEDGVRRLRELRGQPVEEEPDLATDG